MLRHGFISSARMFANGAGAALASVLMVVYPSDTSAADKRPDLDGNWTLNTEESDDAHQKMTEAMQARRERGGRGGGRAGGGGGGGGGHGGPGGGGRGGPGAGGGREAGGPETTAQMLEGYSKLMIHEESEDVQIEYGDELRIYRPDGEKVQRVTELGAFELQTEWKGDRLVIKRKMGDGREIREELRLVEGRLVLDQNIKGRMGTIEIHRVYDRAEASSAAQTESPPEPQ